jgi:hypothetical protein
MRIAGGALMQVKRQIKAGGIVDNHNETLVRVQKPTQGLRVKTHVKAGLQSLDFVELPTPSGVTPTRKGDRP